MALFYLLNSSLQVTSEMRQRFPGVGLAPRDYQHGINRQPRNRQFHPDYNPRHNYTARQTRKPAPVRTGSTYTKNVILVAHDSSDVVPRGAKREELHDTGQIANLVELSTAWEEGVVYERL